MHNAIVLDVLKDDLSHGRILNRFDLLTSRVIVIEDLYVSLAVLIDSKTDVKRCHTIHVRQDWYLVRVGLSFFLSSEPIIFLSVCIIEELHSGVVHLNLITLQGLA